MKILFFTELYHQGGLYNVIVKLIENWPKDDQLVLICNENFPGQQEMQMRFRGVCEVITHAAGIQRFKKTQTPRGIYAKKIQNGLTMIRQYAQLGYHALYFKKLIERYSPDRVMIINGGYPGGYTCRAAALGGLFSSGTKKPIMNYHALPIKPKWLFAIPEFIIDSLIEKSVSCFVTVSKIAEQQLINRPGLSQARKKKVIYNGIDVGLADRKSPGNSNICDELGILKEAPIILMLATYEERKGHDFLLRAFIKVKKEIPDAHLIIAGHGFPEEIQKVKKMIEFYKLSPVIHLLEFRKDVTDLLRQAHIVVMPSQRNESFGLTIIEAMAQRIPIVATMVGGIPEVLENGKGGYVVSLDPDLFADKIINLLKDPVLRRSIGNAGYEVVQKRFTLKRMVEEYFNLTRQPGTDN